MFTFHIFITISLSQKYEQNSWKTHPAIKPHLEGGTCVQYGARVLNEGGYHSLPKLTFPGGMLLGCSAGFLNAVKIKGSHCAIQSGILAAESVYESLTSGGNAEERTVAFMGEIDPEEPLKEVTQYAEAMRKSWVHDELKEVRNCHEAFSKWEEGCSTRGLLLTLPRGRNRGLSPLLQTVRRDSRRIPRPQNLPKSFNPLRIPPLMVY